MFSEIWHNDQHWFIIIKQSYNVYNLVLQCSYINGSPQNTNVPGVVELAKKHGTFIGGDDFKSGQTKIKSVLVDFLVSAGLKVCDLIWTFFRLPFLALELLTDGLVQLQPVSIVSYNHLGNNDGKNLSAPKQFRSKEVNITLQLCLLSDC